MADTIALKGERSEFLFPCCESILLYSANFQVLEQMQTQHVPLLYIPTALQIHKYTIKP